MENSSVCGHGTLDMLQPMLAGFIKTESRQIKMDLLYTPVGKEEQIRALEFLNEHVFSTPYWLLDTNILQNIQAAGSIDRIQSLQRAEYLVLS